jgi:hypothetical protein
MTYPFSVVASGTLNRGKGNVVHGEAVVIWSGQKMAIFGLAASVEFVSDLKRVSVECDEVVEKRNDCPRESDDAREICHGDLLGHHDLGHRQGHRYLARDEVAETFFACMNQYCIPPDVTGIRTAANAKCVVVLRDQSLYPFLYLHLCDRRHGIVLRVRVRGLDGRIAQGGRIVRYARCDGTNLSCRFGLALRGDVVRPLLWITTRSVSQASLLRMWQSHLFLLQLELLRLQQFPGYTNRTVLCTQHQVP